MEKIITKIYELIKETENLIEFEEQLQLLMYDTFSDLVGEAFTHLNKVIKERSQQEKLTVERNDQRTIQFIFGPVTYTRTLFYDSNNDTSFYPLDKWLGFRKYQRYSPLVEVKVAELASESDYRESARILKEWTPVVLSHTTVGSIVRRVGEAQAAADAELVEELDIAATLPKGKKVDFLYSEADGVFIRGTKLKKHHEVYHGITYEGWHKNGERVSLVNPQVILTTRGVNEFWKEMQSSSAYRYSLENTQIITNSDGGKGYSAERFQEAFSQSCHLVLNQLDDYHIKQAINRALGWKTNEFKGEIQCAIKKHDFDKFILWTDTFESTLENEKQIKKVIEFRTYITNHWERIFDWRTKVQDAPKDARTLGSIESRQRHISFRMKKRGMHWSAVGAESMVKIKQGILNGTLREVYLMAQKRSKRMQRDVRKAVRMSEHFRQSKHVSYSRKGSISLHAAHSSAIGRLFKSIT